MRLVGIITMAVIGGAMSSTAFNAAAEDARATTVEGGSCLVGTLLAKAEAFSSPLGGAADEGEMQEVAQASAAHSETPAATAKATVAAAGGECLRGAPLEAALSSGTALAGDLGGEANPGGDGMDSQPLAVAVRQPAAASVVASKPKAAVAVSVTSAEPAAAKAPTATHRKAASASHAKPAKISEAFKPWWPKASEGKLNLAYAGPAAFDSAIVLLFDKSFETAELSNEQIKVIDGSGNLVKSQWVVASGNKKMLTAKVPEGRYMVKVGPKLASTDGSTVVGEFAGPVLVGMK